MPRQPRSAGEYMHMIVRGIGRQILFEEDSDRRCYLSFLEKYCRETDITILAGTSKNSFLAFVRIFCPHNAF